LEDGDDRFAVCNVVDDAPTAATWPGQNILEVDASDQAGPVDARPDGVGDSSRDSCAARAARGFRAARSQQRRTARWRHAPTSSVQRPRSVLAMESAGVE